MDHQMDYVYHHTESSPNHNQVPQSACPYMRGENHQNGPHMLAPLRPSSHYDPVHASSNSWYIHHSPQQYQWPPASAPSSQHPIYHRSTQSASDPFHLNSSSLPPQPTSLNGYQGSAGPDFSYGNPQIPQPSLFPLNSRFAQNATQANVGGPPSQPSFSGDRPWGATGTSRTGNILSTRPPPMPLLAQAEVPENSGEREPEVTQDRPAPPTAQNNSSPPNQTAMDPEASSAGQGDNAPNTVIAHGYTALRENGPVTPQSSSASANPAPASLSERRRVVPGRPRRASSRIYSPQTMERGDGDEDFQSAILDQLLAGSRLPPVDMDERHLRAAQFLRGSVSTKMVASSSAISSLQSVPISELKESERTCVICYNDFGVETPEGVNEAPLRLPKCKHIFGDHCIKKWFEESDSCPYCRDKVPSEPRMHSHHRALANMIRARGSQHFTNLQNEELYLRILASRGPEESGQPGTSATQWQAGRRSPPSDGTEPRRRMRPRHGAARASGSPPTTGNRPVSLGGLPTSGQQQSPSRERAQFTPTFQNTWMQPGSRRSITPALSRSHVPPQVQRATALGSASSPGHQASPRHLVDPTFGEDGTMSIDAPHPLPPMYGPGPPRPADASFPNSMNHRTHLLHPNHQAFYHHHWPAWGPPSSAGPPPPAHELPSHLRNQPYQGWQQ